MLISNKDKKIVGVPAFVADEHVQVAILFLKKFLDSSLEYSLNSAGHSSNIDFFFNPCLL